MFNPPRRENAPDRRFVGADRLDRTWNREATQPLASVDLAMGAVA
jgi:hypothetical protein